MLRRGSSGGVPVWERAVGWLFNRQRCSLRMVGDVCFHICLSLRLQLCLGCGVTFRWRRCRQIGLIRCKRGDRVNRPCRCVTSIPSTRSWGCELFINASRLLVAGHYGDTLREDFSLTIGPLNICRHRLGIDADQERRTYGGSRRIARNRIELYGQQY